MKKFFSFVCIFLLVSLPFVIAAENSADVPLTIDVPSAVRDHRVDVKGSSARGAEVNVFVNKQKVRRVFALDKESFLFPSVVLPSKDNVLSVTAALGGKTTSREQNVFVDSVPPEVSLVIPEFTRQVPLQVNVTSNKAITVSYTVRPAVERVFPAQVSGLSVDNSTENSISFSWNSVGSMKSYLVYRDGVRLDSVSSATGQRLSYIDSKVSSNVSYEYRVSAVDDLCNEGSLSDPMKVLVSQGNTVSPPRSEFELTDCAPTNVALLNGSSVLSVPLQEGVKSRLRIVASDAAGNQVVFVGNTTPDISAPRFLSTNFDQLSPTYDQVVRIRGVVSENSTVIVFVNDKPEKTVVTFSDGRFEADIRLDLSQRFNISLGKDSAKAGISSGFVNKIRLEAIDLAGNKGSHGPQDVQYQVCGEGGLFGVEFGTTIPKKLTPRLMIEGLQTFNFPFKAKYLGKRNVSIRSLRLDPVVMSKREQEKFDNGLVTTRPVRHRVDPRTGEIAGVVTVSVNALDPLSDKKDANIRDKELNLSKYREGECTIPGAGCLKFNYIFEIDYQEAFVQRAASSGTQVTGSQRVETTRQKICFKTEIEIDKPVPFDRIPRGLLKFMAEFFDKAISLIDKLLKPLTTIGTYLTYGCFAGSGLLYVFVGLQSWSCDYSTTVQALIGESKFDKSVAQAGLCDLYQDDAAKDQCNACSDRMKSVKMLENKFLRQTCDRVACPAAPTLQSHIRYNKGEVEKVNSKGLDGALYKQEAEKYGIGSGDKKELFVGSDCAQKGFESELKGAPLGPPSPSGTVMGQQTTSRNMFGSKGQGYDVVVEMYKAFKQGPEQSTLAKDTKVNKEFCEKSLRPAHPACCGFEYMNEWGSACGVGFSQLDTFDELKESTCLGARMKGKNVIDEVSPPESCNVVWNSVAGFCDPESGAPRPEFIGTGVAYDPLVLPNALNNELYVIIVPKVDTKKEVEQYSLYLGYLRAKPEAEAMRRDGKQNKASSRAPKDPKEYLDLFDINAKTQTNTQRDVTGLFYDDKKQLKNCESVKLALVNEIKGVPGVGISSANAFDSLRAKSICEEVRAKIATPEDEYIVRPDSSIFRAVQCVCLPTVTNWLQVWKNIMERVKLCFETVRRTGGGSAGFCQSILSQNICDVLFDAIACFTQKFGQVSGKRFGVDFPFSNVIGAITSAGQETQSRLASRYGESVLWKKMFSEKKLQNAICAFAFTGTWDLNVESLYQEVVASTPVQSQGLVKPCRRRFVDIDPVTGQVGWVYDFNTFLAAGSDLRFDVSLICSKGFKCSPKDGFVNGECDCNRRPKEEVTAIVPKELRTTTLKKGDVLDQQIFYPLQGGEPGSEVRYDRIRLHWVSQDPKLPKQFTEGEDVCEIDATGEEVPSDCQFNIFSNSFKCQIGPQEGTVQLVSGRAQVDPTKKLFVLGDTMRFQVDIRQRIPTVEAREQLKFTKFLGYEVRNPAGTVVAQQLPDQGTLFGDTFNLATNGDYSKTFDAGVVAAEMFAKGVSTVPEVFQFDPEARTLPESASDYVEIVVKDQLPPLLLFEFEGDSKKIVSVYEGRSTAVRTTGEVGFQAGDNLLKANEYVIGVPVTGTFKVNNIPRSFVFTVKKSPLPGTKKLQVQLQTKKAESSAQCPPKPETTSGLKEVWILRLKVFDADKFGTPSTSQSLDPLTNSFVTLDVPFEVACVSSDRLDLVGKAPPVEFVVGLLPFQDEDVKTYSDKLGGKIGEISNDKLSVQRGVPVILYIRTSKDVPSAGLFSVEPASAADSTFLGKHSAADSSFVAYVFRLTPQADGKVVINVGSQTRTFSFVGAGAQPVAATGLEAEIKQFCTDVQNLDLAKNPVIFVPVNLRPYFQSPAAVSLKCKELDDTWKVNLVSIKLNTQVLGELVVLLNTLQSLENSVMRGLQESRDKTVPDVAAARSQAELLVSALQTFVEKKGKIVSNIPTTNVELQTITYFSSFEKFKTEVTAKKDELLKSLDAASLKTKLTELITLIESHQKLTGDASVKVTELQQGLKPASSAIP